MFYRVKEFNYVFVKFVVIINHDVCHIMYIFIKYFFYLGTLSLCISSLSFTQTLSAAETVRENVF